MINDFLPRVPVPVDAPVLQMYVISDPSPPLLHPDGPQRLPVREMERGPLEAPLTAFGLRFGLAH